MPEPDFEYMPLRLAYPFLDSQGLGTAANMVRASKEHLGGYTTTLKRARLAELMRSNGLLEDFIAQHWPHGATPNGRKMLNHLASIYDRYSRTGATKDADPDAEPDETGPSEGSAFAYEDHLRDFLANNLTLLEAGLTLWSPGPDTDSTEFLVGSRRIDILAKDKDGIPVVIELKVSRGHERTIGQCLYYRGRVRQMFGQDTVRIFIVAQKIDEELKIATRELKDVTLFEYSLSMNLKKLTL